MKHIVLWTFYIGLSACALDQLQVEQDPFSQAQAPNFNEELPVDEFAKKNHGVVNVHRHGPGYDIVFTLNAGDSDMIFTMDLPQGGESFMSGLHNQVENESVSNRTRPDRNMEKGATKIDEPGTIEEEGEFFNQKSLSLYSRSTKHMLNAQALFYRKAYWKALEETNKAVSLVPKSAQAYALKGSIYYKMGRKSDAKAAWQTALKLDPNLIDVKQSLSRIE